MNEVFHIENQYTGNDKKLWEQYWREVSEAPSKAEVWEIQKRMENSLWDAFLASKQSNDIKLIKVLRNELVLWYTSFENAYFRNVIRQTITASGLPLEFLDEIIQEISISLCTLIEYYDPNRENKASPKTYLHRYALYALYHSTFYCNYDNQLDYDKYRSYMKRVKAFIEAYGYEPSDLELSTFTGMGEKKFKILGEKTIKKYRIYTEMVSAGSIEDLAKRLSNDQDEEIEIRDTRSLTPEEKLIQKEDIFSSSQEKKKRYQWINELKEPKRTIIILILQGFTMKEIADQLELNHSYVRRLKGEIITELQNKEKENMTF